VTAAAASVLAGARSLTAITEWIADAPRWALLALDFAFDPFSKAVTVPHATTVMQLLRHLDSDVFDVAISTFLQARADTRAGRTDAVAGGRRRREIAARIESRRAEGGVATVRDGPRRNGPRPAADRHEEQ